MAGCRIVNASVEKAVDDIRKIQGEYLTAGQNLITELTRAIADMEGAAKDAIQTFINNDVKKFVAEDMPKAIEGMADLLEANRKNFVEVDQKIADSISGN